METCVFPNQEWCVHPNAEMEECHRDAREDDGYVFWGYPTLEWESHSREIQL